ncbi:MAG: ABC transporter permease [Magnetococcales bacterium]|nr:ABC transporter permease [Magnetococcales bacterium]
MNPTPDGFSTRSLGGKKASGRKGRLAKKSVKNKRPSSVKRIKATTIEGGKDVTISKSFQLRSLQRAWNRFHAGSLSHWTTTIIIALSLTIFGAFTLLLSNANTALEQWTGDNLITVFLEENTTIHQMEEIQNRIAQNPGVDQLSVVSPAQAMGRMKNMLGSEAGLLDNLSENPLPYSIEFRLHDKKYEKTANLAFKIGTWLGVEAVSYDQQWAEKLAAVIRTFRFVGSVLTLLLLTAVALIISNTIKLTIIARRDEVEVMRFMGATDSFIKTPFIYEGVLQGLLGAIGALLLTSLLYWGADGATTELGSAFGIFIELHYLQVNQLLLIMALGIFLGLTGALISLSRFLEI